MVKDSIFSIVEVANIVSICRANDYNYLRRFELRVDKCAKDGLSIKMLMKIKQPCACYDLILATNKLK